MCINVSVGRVLRGIGTNENDYFTVLLDEMFSVCYNNIRKMVFGMTHVCVCRWKHTISQISLMNTGIVVSPEYTESIVFRNERRMNMKRSISIIMVLTMVIVCALSACAENTTPRSIILMTEYQQMGSGEEFQLGALDSEGNLWTYRSETRGDIPFDKEGLLAWAETTDQLVEGKQISDDDLMDIVSLDKTVPAQEISCTSYACDAGEQTSYAIRKDRKGGMEIVVLGISGDDTYENTNPGAQSLYKTLRDLFPGVKAFEKDANAAPAGFQETDILTFCGYKDIDLTMLNLRAYANDCETGLSEIDPAITAEEIAGMRVTGKKNSMCTTGNTIIYKFTDENGDTRACFEFYGDLLVRNDGMYSIKR